MHTTPSQDPSDTSLAKITAEHRALAATLLQVERATDLRTLIPLLKELHDGLEQHFAVEEGPTGLTTAVDEGVPHQMRRLEQIFAEHRMFLSSTTSIMERAQALLDGPKAEIIRDVHHLIRDLRAHEEAETEIVMDSVYSDIGSGD